MLRAGIFFPKYRTSRSRLYLYVSVCVVLFLYCSIAFIDIIYHHRYLTLRSPFTISDHHRDIMSAFLFIFCKPNYKIMVEWFELQ